jgi:choline kinase
MRGIILAAGRGSRMGRMTTEQPKCLTELLGKSLLHWQLNAFKEAGIPQIATVTGYCSERLVQEVEHTFHNTHWAKTNMVMSLMAADPWLSQDICIVSYSDIVYHPNHLLKLKQTEGDVALTYDTKWQDLWALRFADPLSDAETFRVDPNNGLLVSIGERAKTLDEIEGQYMGLLKITPTGWAKIKTHLHSLPPEVQNQLDMTTLLNQLLQKKQPIQTVPVSGEWCEVDTETDWLCYETQINSQRAWSHDWRLKVCSYVP